MEMMLLDLLIIQHPFFSIYTDRIFIRAPLSMADHTLMIGRLERYRIFAAT